MAPKRAAVVFTEKEFYLDEFRGRTLVFAVHHAGSADRLRALGHANVNVEFDPRGAFEHRLTMRDPAMPAAVLSATFFLSPANAAIRTRNVSRAASGAPNAGT